MAYTIKQHDTYPDLVLTLSDTNGAINLTTATTVKLILKSGVTTITGNMTITNALTGVVTFTWSPANTATPGTFDGEVEITWNNGKVETVPNDSYFSITIMADLG